MREFIESATEALSASVPHPAKEYIDEEGFARCAVCNDRVECLVSVPALGIERKVRCICSCAQKERDEHKEREKQQDLHRERMKCFAESNMHTWTFENDDRSNERLSGAMQRYVDNFAEFKKDGKGLLLYGPCGTGKTYFAACIANALIDKGHSCYMTNFTSISNQLFGMREGKQEFLNSLNKYTLLIIDDLGAERQSEFMQEQVYNIIDSRYRSGLPFIVTTNLTWQEMTKPETLGCARIYDRVIERCFPAEVAGTSRRRQNVKDTFQDVKSKLGL
jgi:DNA replication protein DnaC